MQKFDDSLKDASLSLSMPPAMLESGRVLLRRHLAQRKSAIPLEEGRLARFRRQIRGLLPRFASRSSFYRHCKRRMFKALLPWWKGTRASLKAFVRRFLHPQRRNVAFLTGVAHFSRIPAALALVLMALAAAPASAQYYVQQPGEANPLAALEGTEGIIRPAFVDIDNDGDQDVFGFDENRNFQFYENAGTATSPNLVERNGAENPMNGERSDFSRPMLAFVDIDADGDQDAFLSENYSDYGTQFIENTGTASAPVFVFREDAANPLSGLFAYGTVIGLAFGDLDGDGDQDLLAGTGDYSRRVAYFENTGSPAAPVFAERTGIENPLDGALDRRPDFGPALVDFDGDGDLDVAFALNSYGSGSSEVLYFENAGSTEAALFRRIAGAGNPLAPVFFPGNNPSLALVDLDGDGDLDSVAGDSTFSGFGRSLGTIRYFENTSTTMTRTFGEHLIAGSPFAALDAGYGTHALADVDGDGDVDLVGGSDFGALRFIANTGTPGAPVFSEQSGVASPFYGLSYGNGRPALGDLDGDGDTDMLLGSNGTVRYFENTGAVGAPAFTLAAPEMQHFSGFSFGYGTTPALADVDADGDLDAFFAAQNVPVRYFENTGTADAPAFTERSGAENPLNLLTLGYRAQVTFGDLDADGDLDAIGSGRSYSAYIDNIQYFENMGTPAAPVFVLLAGADNPLGADVAASGRSAVAGDIDGDGDPDLLLNSPNYATGRDYVFLENLGDRSRANLELRLGEQNPIDELGSNHTYSTPILADLDGDADDDAIITDPFGQVRYLENTGTPSAPAFVERIGAANPIPGVLNGSYVLPIAFGDLDGDSDLDMIAAAGDSVMLHYFENVGSAQSPEFVEDVETSPLHGLYLNARLVALVDIDGDDDLDLFAGTELDKRAGARKGRVNAIQYLENTGSSDAAEFTPRADVENPLFEVGAYAYGQQLAFGDVDGDGDVDLLMSGILYGDTVAIGLFYVENSGSAVAPQFAIREAAANPFDGIRTDLASGLGLSDIDGDDDLDLFVGRAGGEVRFFENVETAPPVDFEQALDAANPLDAVEVDPGAQLSLVDIEGDGDQDLFVTGRFLIGKQAGEGEGEGEPTGTVARFFENVGSTIAPVFEERTGAGNPLDGHMFGSYLPILAFADVDGDGDQDALASNFQEFPEYLENQGTAGAPDFVAAPLSESPLGTLLGDFGLSRIQFVDSDGDGDRDILAASLYGSPAFTYIENTGTESAPVYEAGAANPLENLAGKSYQDFVNFAFATIYDLDADGDLDLFYSDFDYTILFTGGSRFRWVQNLGTPEAGEFEDISGLANPLNAFPSGWLSSPAFADFDGDGDPDVVAVGPIDLTTESAGLLYLENITGTGVVVPTVDEAAAALLENFASADLDTSGTVSLSEAQVLIPLLTEAVFNEIDADDNGTLDEAELDLIVNGPPCTVDPNLDTDGDGLTDCDEADADTDPENVDSDGDGMPDGFEVEFGLQPLNGGDADQDKDGDGISNYDEFLNGTDPADTSDPNPTLIVSTTGSDTNEGSAANPLQTVAGALARHTANGGGAVQIILEPGVYVGDFTLNPGVRLIGRLNVAGEVTVIIQGEVTGANDSTIESIEIQPAGEKDGEVLLSNNNSNMTVRRVRFTGSPGARTATGIDATGENAASMLIENCDFTDLLVGVNIMDGVPVIRKSLFLDPALAGILVQESAILEGEGGLSVSSDAASGFNTFKFEEVTPDPVAGAVAVRNETDETLRMENNDWDTNDAGEIENLISGPNDFEPFLAKGSAILSSTIFVTVWDRSDQKRLTEVSVELEGSSFDAVTDNDNGVYVFPAVPEGPYEVVCTTTGFKDFEMGVDVGEGEIVPVSVPMAKADGPVEGEGEGEGEGETKPNGLPIFCNLSGSAGPDAAYGDLFLLLCLLAVLSGAVRAKDADADTDT